MINAPSSPAQAVRRAAFSIAMLAAFPFSVLAQSTGTATSAPAANGHAEAPNAAIASFLPWILIGVVFYLLILRPQRKSEQQTQQMRDSVKKGDRVKTVGGAYGTVVSVDSDAKTVKLEFDKNVRIDFDRAAISVVLQDAKPS